MQREQGAARESGVACVLVASAAWPRCCWWCCTSIRVLQHSQKKASLQDMVQSTRCVVRGLGAHTGSSVNTQQRGRTEGEGEAK